MSMTAQCIGNLGTYMSPVQYLGGVYIIKIQ